MDRCDTALLVMDAQDWLVDRLGAAEVLPAVAAALGAARSTGVPVIHVGFGLRAGSPSSACATALSTTSVTPSERRRSGCIRRCSRRPGRLS